VMQASNLLLIDICGGRQSDLYIKTNRRLFMLLAMVRIAFTRITSNRAHVHGDPAEKILMWAARLILASSFIFAMTVNETLPAKEKKRFSMSTAWVSASTFFFQSKARLLIALSLILRSMPFYSGTAMTALQRNTFHWGPADRALFSNAMDIAEVVYPLVVNEVLQIQPMKGRGALVWGSRFTALALLNIAVSPYSKSFLLNTVLERLVSSQPFFDDLLEHCRADQGEGLLESAVSTLEFPVGMIVPPILVGVSQTFGERFPFYLLAATALINSEVMSRLL